MNRLIIGCGYLGRRVAEEWRSNGDHLSVLTRSRGAMFREMGFHPIVGDITVRNSLPMFPAVETVLFAVGFDRSQNKNIHEVYVDGLANVLDRLHPDTGQIIYISSTGVYGNNAGEVVDEQTPANPERDGGRACLAAEELIKQSGLASRATILRLAGIYGKGRVPMLNRTRPGISAKSYLNLIHVGDAANVVAECAVQKPHAETFLVSDGSPVLRGDYYAEIMRYVASSDSVIEWGSPSENVSGKRINNNKLRERLNYSPKYPTYRDGLAAIFSKSE